MQYKNQKFCLDIAPSIMYNIIAVKNNNFTKAKYFTEEVLVWLKILKYHTFWIFMANA